MEATRLFSITWFDESYRFLYHNTEFSCDTEEEALGWFYDEYADDLLSVEPNDVYVEMVGYTVYDGDDTFDFYCE